MSHGRGSGMGAVRRGRQARIEGEISSERIWAWLTPTERASLDEVAAESGMKIAVIIREAVNDFVAEYSERRVFSVTVNSPQHLS